MTRPAHIVKRLHEALENICRLGTRDWHTFEVIIRTGKWRYALTEIPSLGTYIDDQIWHDRMHNDDEWADWGTKVIVTSRAIDGYVVRIGKWRIKE